MHGQNSIKRLLNLEFEWDREHLSNKPPLEGPSIPITYDKGKKTILMMKSAMLQANQA